MICLNTIYNIFFKKNVQQNTLPIWYGKTEQKVRFFLTRKLIPLEFFNLNPLIWKDKSRRCRFLSNSNNEPHYQNLLINYLSCNPFIISKMEHHCRSLLLTESEKDCFSRIANTYFLELASMISPSIKQYIGFDNCSTDNSFERKLTFLILYALIDLNCNMVYRKFITHNLYRATLSNNSTSDLSVFVSEYPQDGQRFHPGELIKHTWILKNQGNVTWNNRYCSCLNPDNIGMNSKNLDIIMPEKVFPGMIVSLEVSFNAPTQPGIYELFWKMKESDIYVFPELTGLGLHFSVVNEININNPPISLLLREDPPFPKTYSACEKIHHTWFLKNIGKTTWRNYSFICTNATILNYAKQELSFRIGKNVFPGETVIIHTDFFAPCEAGNYFFSWNLLDSNGLAVAPPSQEYIFPISVYDN